MYFILLLLLGVSAAFAAPDVDSLIVNAPGLETYPQASAVILLDRTRIELLPSGQTVRHEEMLCKMLSRRSDQQLVDQLVKFSPDNGTLVMETLRVRRPDERWVDLLYESVSFPVLPASTVVRLAYRIESKPSQSPHADGIELFGGYEPCLDRQLTIEVSPPWKIRYELQNGALEPLVSESGDQIIYGWSVRDCPQIVREPGSVGLSDLVPSVLWTSFSDWEELGVYAAEPFWEKVDSSQAAVDGFLQITSPELQGIPALMNAAIWVLRNIRTGLPPLGSMDYEPHSADHVWQNHAGNPLDKAVLLTSLLRAYGFAPIPVLVPNSPAPFSKLPVLDQFHHIILAVPVGEDTLWFDPTAEYYPPGTLPYSCTYGKGCMLLAGTPLLMDVPAGSPESRGARTEMRLNLAEDGTLSGIITCVPSGDLAADARRLFKNQNAQEQDAYAQAAASRIKPGATVTSFSASDPGDLSQPLTVTLGFESPGYAERQEDTILLPLPANPFDFALSGFSASLPEVRYPVQLPPRRRVTTEVSLSLPKGYVVSYLPPALIVDNPYLNIGLSARSNAAGLTWTQTIEIKGDKVPVSDYPAVRNAFETLLSPKNHLVILEKK